MLSSDMSKKSENGHFEIKRTRTDGHDHFMCAEYKWSIVDLRTGKCIATYDEDFRGTFDGVEHIVFSPDSREIIVTNHDGTVERRTLPE